MITLSDLQTLIQFFARDNGFALTATPYLDMANLVYRGMVSVLRFGETVQVRDPWFTCAAGTANYVMPQDPSWIDITAFEMQDPDDQNSYKPVLPFKDEQAWTLAANKPAAFPEMRRVMGGGTITDVNIWFAPAPKAASSVRVRGTIEPPPMVAPTGDETWRSIFDSRFKDDILALLISATININRAQPDLAQVNIGGAIQRLKQISAWTVQVEEQLRGVVGVDPIGAGG